MLFRREAFRQLKRGLGPMPGVRALPLSAPKGRPLPRGGLFPRRRGAASGQGRGPVKAFRGATDASISQKRFLRLALGRTAVSGFSTKKAISRLRRPFAADDGAQNRRFEQASDGRHGKARSFFVCGDAAAAPEDGASDHGIVLFVSRGTFRPPQEGMARCTAQATNPKTPERFFTELSFGMALRGLRSHGLRRFLFLPGPL